MDESLPDNIRGYIAGLFEGEGTVQGKDGWSLRIAMTDLEPLQVCKGALGGSLRGPYIDKRGGRKPFWTWGLFGYANVSEFYSLVGGLLSPRRQEQFRLALSNKPKEYPESPRCGVGTVAGYGRHKKRREPPCSDCRRAWNIYHYQRNHNAWIENLRLAP